MVRHWMMRCAAAWAAAAAAALPACAQTGGRGGDAGWYDEMWDTGPSDSGAWSEGDAWRVDPRIGSAPGGPVFDDAVWDAGPFDEGVYGYPEYLERHAGDDGYYEWPYSDYDSFGWPYGTYGVYGMPEPGPGAEPYGVIDVPTWFTADWERWYYEDGDEGLFDNEGPDYDESVFDDDDDLYDDGLLDGDDEWFDW